MIRKLGLAAVRVLAFVVLGAAGAGAHVTVSPSRIPQGTSDVILTFRVPNESATAVVTGLRVQFPLDHPIILLNPEAGSGWRVTVVKTALKKPVTTDDGTFTSTVSEIDWSGGSIPVGQFGAFNVLAQGIPTGTPELAFKAIQSYGDGTVVSWIEVPNKTVPNPAHPAPTLALTAPEKKGTSATASSASSGAATVVTAVGQRRAVDRRTDPGRLRRAAQRPRGVARPSALGRAGSREGRGRLNRTTAAGVAAPCARVRVPKPKTPVRVRATVATMAAMPVASARRMVPCHSHHGEELGMATAPLGDDMKKGGENVWISRISH